MKIIKWICWVIFFPFLWIFRKFKRKRFVGSLWVGDKKVADITSWNLTCELSSEQEWKTKDRVQSETFEAEGYWKEID